MPANRTKYLVIEQRPGVYRGQVYRYPPDMTEPFVLWTSDKRYATYREAEEAALAWLRANGVEADPA